ncbi:hypothetical protein MF406_12405 [Georgenia sp. TF02-10]|uniref:hypothetical protein n=1 Tax=Georgenia sp. TF02-10 TaxID=2917725 RepID=UPI001FA7A15A|nr:hypothetical protein [Georgenia sp. TF02-10]UNX53778.1 hypothetical protein MF406_12405 [Georgenia sp. TF02-10]
MTSSLVTFAEEAEHAAETAAINPYVAGALTLAIFVVLLMVTYAFRNVRTRHR